MRFEFGGVIFAITFRRERRSKDKHPTTFATLLMQTEGKDEHGRPLFREVANGKAKCHPSDSFSKEQGRVKALRAISNQLDDKDFRTILWKTYQNRVARPEEVR